MPMRSPEAASSLADSAVTPSVTARNSGVPPPGCTRASASRAVASPSSRSATGTASVYASGVPPGKSQSPNSSPRCRPASPAPTASATTVARVRPGGASVPPGTTLPIELDVSTRTSSRLGSWAASWAA